MRCDYNLDIGQYSGCLDCNKGRLDHEPKYQIWRILEQSSPRFFSRGILEHIDDEYFLKNISYITIIYYRKNLPYIDNYSVHHFIIFYILKNIYILCFPIKEWWAVGVGCAGSPGAHPSPAWSAGRSPAHRTIRARTFQPIKRQAQSQVTNQKLPKRLLNDAATIRADFYGAK